MSAFVIVMYLTAVISVLLGVAGFIMLIYGLIVKNKRLTISGSIFTGVAIIIIISGVFCIAGRAAHFVKNRHLNRMEFNKEFCNPGGQEWMEMDSTMCKGDSLMQADDSCCAKMRVKCGHMGKMKCMKMMKCDPADCKSKCPKEKK